MSTRKLACALWLAALGCGGAPGDEGLPPAPAVFPPVYAEVVVSTRFGPGAGYGQDSLPEVVLGPPSPGPSGSGSLDVLSLGVGGEIVLGFGAQRVVDGAGPDLVVFENPFIVQGDPRDVFSEPGEVSVSADGVTWVSFPCDPTRGAEGGCAGTHVVWPYAVATMDPLEPEATGGDAFDLAEVGLSEARFVRIRDMSTDGEGPSAGFDLDAVGGVYLE
jgi:hypothetical protein